MLLAPVAGLSSIGIPRRSVQPAERSMKAHSAIPGCDGGGDRDLSKRSCQRVRTISRFCTLAHRGSGGSIQNTPNPESSLDILRVLGRSRPEDLARAFSPSWSWLLYLHSFVFDRYLHFCCLYFWRDAGCCHGISPCDLRCRLAMGIPACLGSKKRTRNLMPKHPLWVRARGATVTGLCDESRKLGNVVHFGIFRKQHHGIRAA